MSKSHPIERHIPSSVVFERKGTTFFRHMQIKKRKKSKFIAFSFFAKVQKTLHPCNMGIVLLKYYQEKEQKYLPSALY